MNECSHLPCKANLNWILCLGGMIAILFCGCGRNTAPPMTAETQLAGKAEDGVENEAQDTNEQAPVAQDEKSEQPGKETATPVEETTTDKSVVVNNPLLEMESDQATSPSKRPSKEERVELLVEKLDPAKPFSLFIDLARIAEIDESAFARLLKDNPQWVKLNHRGSYMIHRFAEDGTASAMQILIDAGADVNEESGFGLPLEKAIGHSQKEVVKVLLENGAQPGEGVFFGPAIADAFRSEDPEMGEIVGSYCKDLPERTLEEVAVAAMEAGNVRGLAFALDEGLQVKGTDSGTRLLSKAVHVGSKEAIELLIQSEVALDYIGHRGVTILHDAVGSEKFKEMLDYLVEEKDIDVDTSTEQGGSALVYAAFIENPRAIEHLLALGADPSITSRSFASGGSARYMAVRTGNAETCKLLGVEPYQQFPSDGSLVTFLLGKEPSEITGYQWPYCDGLPIDYISTDCDCEVQIVSRSGKKKIKLKTIRIWSVLSGNRVAVFRFYGKKSASLQEIADQADAIFDQIGLSDIEASDSKTIIESWRQNDPSQTGFSYESNELRVSFNIEKDRDEQWQLMFGPY